MQPHRFRQQITRPANDVTFGGVGLLLSPCLVIFSGVIRKIPVAMQPGAALLRHQRMPRRQTAHAFKQRLRPDHIAKGQIRIQRIDVHTARRGRVGKQRLGLAGEQQQAVAFVQVQRLHADMIDGQHQTMCVCIPQGKGVHAAQMPEQVKAIVLVQVDDGFAIAGGVRLVPALHQRLAQFAIVINLAVKHQRDAAILVVQRLVAAFHVDDAQAAHAQRHIPPAVKAVAIRPTMPDQVRHRAHQRRVRPLAPCQVHKSTNAAHISLSTYLPYRLQRRKFQRFF